MLFEMLTGEWPFTGGAVEVMGKKCVLDAPSPLDINSNLHPELAAVSQKMIARAKENRYKSCANVIKALESVDLKSPVIFSSVEVEKNPFSESDFLVPPKIKPVKAKTSEIASLKTPPIRARKTNTSHNSDSSRPSSHLKKLNKPKSTALTWTVIGGSAICIVAFALFRIYPAVPTDKLDNGFADPRIVNSDHIPSSGLSSPPNVDASKNILPPQIESETPNQLPIEVSLNLGELQSQQSTTAAFVAALELEPEPMHLAESETSVETAKETSDEADGASIASEDLETDEADPIVESGANTVGLIEKAMRLIQTNQRKESIPLLKRASNLSPKDPRADFYLGLLHIGHGSNQPKEARSRIENAETHFSRAFNRTIEGTDERIATANNFGLVEVKLRKIPAARNYLGIAAKQNPRASEVNHNLGRLLSLVKNYDIKPDDLKRITGLYTEPAAYRPHTGWLYMPLDKSEKTLRDCAVICPRGVLEDASCTVCNGCAQLICKKCVGRGTIGIMGSSSEKKEHAFGVTTIVTTPFTNFVSCPECRGKGRIDCHACQDGGDPNLRR